MRELLIHTSLVLLIVGWVGCRSPRVESPEPKPAPPPPAEWEPEPTGEPEPLPEPEKILRAEGWELQISYRLKGTRSEGQHGVLFHEGKPVEGTEVGETRETPIGVLEYYGATTRFPWMPTGWNYADPFQILPSWKDPANP